jgi:hypothetical protein
MAHDCLIVFGMQFSDCCFVMNFNLPTLLHDIMLTIFHGSLIKRHASTSHFSKLSNFSPLLYM